MAVVYQKRAIYLYIYINEEMYIYIYIYKRQLLTPENPILLIQTFPVDGFQLLFFFGGGVCLSFIPRDAFGCSFGVNHPAVFQRAKQLGMMYFSSK